MPYFRITSVVEGYTGSLGANLSLSKSLYFTNRKNLNENQMSNIDGDAEGIDISIYGPVSLSVYKADKITQLVKTISVGPPSVGIPILDKGTYNKTNTFYPFDEFVNSFTVPFENQNPFY